MISYSHQGGEASLPKNIAIKVARAQKDMTQKALAVAKVAYIYQCKL